MMKSSFVRVLLACRRFTMRFWYRLPALTPFWVAFWMNTGPLSWFSIRLLMLVQRGDTVPGLLSHTVVACGLTCVAAEAAVAPASPRAELTATDAASTYSPLMERLRMGDPFLWILGRPPRRVAWAVKLWPAATDCCCSLRVTCCDSALSVSGNRLVMSRLLTISRLLSPTPRRTFDWPDSHEHDVRPAEAVDQSAQIHRRNFAGTGLDRGM